MYISMIFILNNEYTTRDIRRNIDIHSFIIARPLCQICLFAINKDFMCTFLICMSFTLILIKQKI